MKLLKALIPLTLVPASLYGLHYFLFSGKFSPPDTENVAGGIKTPKCKNIIYLTENNLPYPTQGQTPRSQ